MSKIVVGTLYRKAPSRAHLEPTEADIIRKNMKVTQSYVDQINENAKKDPKAIEVFKVDKAATLKYYEDAAAHKAELDQRSKLAEAEKSGIASDLIKAAAANMSVTEKSKPAKASKTEKVVEEVEEEDDSELVIEDEREALFERAEKLGLKVAKNLSTEKLKLRVEDAEKGE